MPKLLITAACLSQSHALKNKLKGHTILLGDYHSMPSLSSQPLFLQLPSPHSAAYVHEFLALCISSEIEQVYVLDRAEIIHLKPSLTLFEEYGIELHFTEIGAN